VHFPTLPGAACVDWVNRSPSRFGERCRSCGSPSGPRAAPSCARRRRSSPAAARRGPKFESFPSEAALWLAA
jgi:hypothetical protein